MSPFSIVMTMVLLVLFVLFLRYLFTDPYTLQNVQNAQTASTIPASSLATNGSNTPSSNFAYSVWFYINDWNYRYGEPKIIFGRMGASSHAKHGSLTNINGLDPCPVVWLDPTENNVNVSLGCFPQGGDSSSAQQSIPEGANAIVYTGALTNVPLQKWVHLVVSVYGRTMDLYLDGKLARTCLLPGVAHVNASANVHVTPSGGFDGYTGKLQYYPTSLNPQEVWNIYTNGYSSWISMFNSYKVQLSLVENGNTQSSITF